MYNNMEIAVKLVMFGCIFSLAMASWIPGRPPPKIEDYSNEPSKVQVEVYYETLCPDTRYFIRQQLYPVWQDLKHIMDIHWKPYGKATHWEKSSNDISSNDVYAFNCQHGPPECEGNKVHACVVKYVTDDEKRMDFIHCMINDNYKPVECGEKCSMIHDVAWEPILDCVNSEEGSNLLAMHGDDTHSLRPKMTFVPHIVMNGRYIKPEDALTGSFKHYVCSAFRGSRPEQCLDII